MRIERRATPRIFHTVLYTLPNMYFSRHTRRLENVSVMSIQEGTSKKKVFKRFLEFPNDIIKHILLLACDIHGTFVVDLRTLSRRISTLVTKKEIYTKMCEKWPDCFVREALLHMTNENYYQDGVSRPFPQRIKMKPGIPMRLQGGDFILDITSSDTPFYFMHREDRLKYFPLPNGETEYPAWWGTFYPLDIVSLQEGEIVVWWRICKTEKRWKILLQGIPENFSQTWVDALGWYDS